ncbi:MAG: class I SAM-dependent methyltransferase [Ruminococcus sp.]|nr:class I SAM-dependent methyltransferase [Ruminococcus sp.]
MNVTKLEKCRVCGNTHIEEVLNLGEQELTGVFPKSKNEKLTSGLLDLYFCPECGLLQLGHSYSLDEMYGDNYGYRSGLNPSMVEHLSSKINMLETMYNLKSGDVVLDIGSNDGTSLNSYKTEGVRRIGMDPTGKKFRQYYNEGVELIPDFFSVKSFSEICDKKVKIVTSISMFYDLESPIDFAKQVNEILADDGIWHLEQSYMPTMLRNNSYDTVCHEHLEYYSLGAIKYIMDVAGLRILDVSTNDINGGSFAITVAKKDSAYKSNSGIINWFLGQEKNLGLDTLKPYLDFAARTVEHRIQLKSLLDSLAKDGKLVCGYGASTKGNVILQYCGITEEEVKVFGEVNPDKFGSFTPSTYIPIDDEEKVRAMKPDYFLVMPWHFRNGILAKEKEYLKSGGHFIFPLPFIDIV